MTTNVCTCIISPIIRVITTLLNCRQSWRNPKCLLIVVPWVMIPLFTVQTSSQNFFCKTSFHVFNFSSRGAQNSNFILVFCKGFRACKQKKQCLPQAKGDRTECDIMLSGILTPVYSIWSDLIWYRLIFYQRATFYHLPSLSFQCSPPPSTTRLRSDFAKTKKLTTRSRNDRFFMILPHFPLLCALSQMQYTHFVKKIDFRACRGSHPVRCSARHTTDVDTQTARGHRNPRTLCTVCGTVSIIVAELESGASKTCNTLATNFEWLLLSSRHLKVQLFFYACGYFPMLHRQFVPK